MIDHGRAGVPRGASPTPMARGSLGPDDSDDSLPVAYIRAASPPGKKVLPPLQPLPPKGNNHPTSRVIDSQRRSSYGALGPTQAPSCSSPIVAKDPLSPCSRISLSSASHLGSSGVVPPDSWGYDHVGSSMNKKGSEVEMTVSPPPMDQYPYHSSQALAFPELPGVWQSSGVDPGLGGVALSTESGGVEAPSSHFFPNEDISTSGVQLAHRVGDYEPGGGLEGETQPLMSDGRSSTLSTDQKVLPRMGEVPHQQPAAVSPPPFFGFMEANGLPGRVEEAGYPGATSELGIHPRTEAQTLITGQNLISGPGHRGKSRLCKSSNTKPEPWSPQDNGTLEVAPSGHSISSLLPPPAWSSTPPPTASQGLVSISRDPSVDPEAPHVAPSPTPSKMKKKKKYIGKAIRKWFSGWGHGGSRVVPLNGPPFHLTASMDGSLTGSLSDVKRTWRIHVVTFNMGDSTPEVIPEDLLKEHLDGVDILIVGSQESGDVEEWEQLIEEQLGEDYEKLGSQSLWAIHLVVYVLSRVRHRIYGQDTSSVTTGIGNVIGNKGGVAMRLMLDNLSVLVVCAHFAAHDEYVMRRNADYHRICNLLFTNGTPADSHDWALRTSTGGLQQGLEGSQHSTTVSFTSSTMSASQPLHSCASADLMGSFPPPSAPASPNPFMQTPSHSSIVSRGTESFISLSPTPDLHRGKGSILARAVSVLSMTNFMKGPPHTSKDVTSDYDLVLWLGDLNYRINGRHHTIHHLVQRQAYEVLRANDQLRLQQKKGLVFKDFHEETIEFPPTFKYVINSDKYDDKRVPSYTDRVLWKVNASHPASQGMKVRCLYYDHVKAMRTSDHRPVIAGLELSREGEDRTVLLRSPETKKNSWWPF